MRAYKNLNTLETESNLNNPGDIDLHIREILEEFNPDNIDPVELDNTLKELEMINSQLSVNNPKIIQKDINQHIENNELQSQQNDNNSDTDTAHSGESSQEANFTLLDDIINNKAFQLIVKKSPYVPYLKI